MFAKDDLDYINGRLTGTIVSYKSEPVYVTGVKRSRDNGIIVDYLYLKDTAKPFKVNIDELDMRPVRLGYINFDKRDCAWFCRIPKRAWKQGLTNDHVSNSVGVNINLTDNLIPLRNTVLGNYPTLEQASRLKFKTAFSRDFAIRKDEIFYKDFDCVGYYREGKASLKDRFLYLREYLEEVLVANL